MGTSLLERASFFKVMLGDFKRSLQIPTDFKRYTGENLCGKSILRSCRGRQWYVKLENFGGCFFFQDGWETFVADNGVSLEDFLVFFYDGESGFDVKIYGVSGCQKEERLPTVEVKEEPGIASENLSKSLPMGPCKGLPTDSKKRKADSVGSKNNLCFKVMKCMKPTENEKVLRAACSMETSHPHFIALCSKTRSTQVTIPAELVKYYNLGARKSLILQDPHGKSWRVELSTRNDGRVCLSTGWSDFYKERCLKDGDACVFEFVQRGSALNIHIFTVEECTTKWIPESGRSAESRVDLLAKDDKERILRKANSFQTKHPKFVALWRLCRLYSMPIPKKVVKEVGIRSSRCATLYDPSGREWPVDITYRSYGKVEMGIGWCNFSRGNNLALGDACVFEFTGGTDTVQVHIFRLREENASTPAATRAAEQNHNPKLEKD